MCRLDVVRRGDLRIFIGRLKIDVNGRKGSVHLHFCAGSGEFDGALGTGNRIDCGAQNVAPNLAIDFAAALIERHQLRLT